MKCQSLVDGDKQCFREAIVRVSGTPGWTGVHCRGHAAKVVRTQIFQVVKGRASISVDPL